MLGLVISAISYLVLVGFIIWKDLTYWNKDDIGTILFESRTGQPISLGIGMVVMHYLLIGLSLLAAGVVLFSRNRILAGVQQQEIPMQTQKTSPKKPFKKLLV